MSRMAMDRLVVIEATGHPDAISTRLRCSRTRGALSIVGEHERGETPKVNFYRDVHKKGTHTLRGAQFYPPAPRILTELLDT